MQIRGLRADSVRLLAVLMGAGACGKTTRNVGETDPAMLSSTDCACQANSVDLYVRLTTGTGEVFTLRKTNQTFKLCPAQDAQPLTALVEPDCRDFSLVFDQCEIITLEEIHRGESARCIYLNGAEGDYTDRTFVQHPANIYYRTVEQISPNHYQGTFDFIPWAGEWQGSATVLQEGPPWLGEFSLCAYAGVSSEPCRNQEFVDAGADP